jgi:subtilisin-like proprotein convertase family protein
MIPKLFVFIALVLASSGAIAAESDRPQRIPDANRRGMSSTLTLEDVGYVDRVRVSIDIDHADASDLVVTLFAPSGTQATLHDRFPTRGGVHRTWTLEDFGGERSGGRWTLQSDRSASHDSALLFTGFGSKTA